MPLLDVDAEERVLGCEDVQSETRRAVKEAFAGQGRAVQGEVRI
jgi:hypothetical protein